MDTNAAVTLALGVGTILASGITSAVVTYLLNRRKDQTEFMRTKAEALYLAADEYGRTLGIYVIEHYGVAKGDIEWNQMLDRQLSLGSKAREHGGAELLTMLTEIYFPTVRPSLAKLFEARDSFNRLVTDMKRSYRRDQGQLDRNTWIPKLNQHGGAIDACITELQQSIISAARSYAGIRQN